MPGLLMAGRRSRPHRGTMSLHYFPDWATRVQIPMSLVQASSFLRSSGR